MTVPSHLDLASPASCRHTHDLLEDWPRRASSSPSIEAEQDDEIEINAKRPQVSFSESSMLVVYKEDDAYTKAFSEADYDLFQHAMRLDAHRVKELIKRAPQESTKESIKFLFENNIIATEDFVGIEHIVLGKGGLVRQARQLHARKVLQQQHEQRQQQPDDRTESLAKVAKESSLKSIYFARVRAQWLLHKDKNAVMP